MNKDEALGSSGRRGKSVKTVVCPQISGDQIAILGGQNGTLQTHQFASGETLSTTELINRCSDTPITGGLPGGGTTWKGGAGRRPWSTGKNGQKRNSSHIPDDDFWEIAA